MVRATEVLNHRVSTVNEPIFPNSHTLWVQHAPRANTCWSSERINNYRVLTSGDGTRRSSMEERPLMVRWLVGSIPSGGPIELFLVLISASYVV